jgi:hypothetical protein
MKKDCTTCKSAKFRTTATGRRDLRMGACLAEVDLPNSFLSFAYDELPQRRGISKYTPANCRLWEKTD